MKKLIILSVLLFSIVFVSQAQMKSGIKVGYGVADARGMGDTDGKTSFKIGVSSDIYLSKFFGLRPALYISNKGYEKAVVGATLKTSANYLELPVCFALKLPLTKNIRVSANAGPYFAYGIGGKTKIKGIEVNEKWKTFEGKTIDDIEYAAVERFDWGGTFAFSIGLFAINIGINYDLGLKNIYKMQKPDRRENMKNGMWWFSVGFLF